MMRRLLSLSLTIAAGLVFPLDAVVIVRKELNLVATSNNFTCTFVRTLLSDHSKFDNFLVSPFNIQEAIFLLMNAAENKTYAEIAKLYGLPAGNTPYNSVRINTQFKSILKRLQVNDKDAQVDLATALYVQKTCPLRNCYKTDMAYYYGAKTETEDFVHNSTAVTKKINSFVNQKTRGKIPILYDEPLPSDTKLIMLAVLYFNSSWYGNFFILNDKKSNFNLLSGESKSLQCLNNHNGQKNAGYTVLDSCQVVRILYSNTNYSFFVFLPPRGQDPTVCLKKLTTEKISYLFNVTDYKQSVNVTIPRFAFDYSFKNLVPNFQKLGVKQAFIDADLTNGIDQCKCGKLYVDQIVHKCRIEVSEKGTTAAAVTGIGVRALAVAIPISKPIQFNVDRPFAFLIACSNPEIVLFAGSNTNPIYPNH